MRQSPGGCLLAAGARAFPQDGRNPLAPREGPGTALGLSALPPTPTYVGCASLRIAIQRLSAAPAGIHILLRIVMSEHPGKTYT